MTAKPSAGQSTLSIWGGEQEHELYERSTQVPVVHSVSFTYKDIDTWHDVALEKAPGHIYSRNTNPTVRAFRRQGKGTRRRRRRDQFRIRHGRDQ